MVNFQLALKKIELQFWGRICGNAYGGSWKSLQKKKEQSPKIVFL
jgi:hypothetical protein